MHKSINESVDTFMQENLGPMAGMFTAYKPKIIDKILSGIEVMATDALQNGGELHIGEKIENKINAMDIKHLELLILGFSKKQFKHITLFGGILGAIIGIVQATITLFTATF